MVDSVTKDNKMSNYGSQPFKRRRVRKHARCKYKITMVLDTVFHTSCNNIHVCT